MANLYDGATLWAFENLTGGTDNCLDWAGSVVSADTPAIKVGDIAKRFNSSAKSFSLWIVESSGATADGSTVVSPVQAALDNAGDQDLRWHNYGSSSDSGPAHTISASDPSGGEDGDIWFKVSS